MALSNQEVRDRGSRRSPKAESWRSFRRYNASLRLLVQDPHSDIVRKMAGIPTHAQSRLIQCGRLIQVSTLFGKNEKHETTLGFPKVSRFKCLHRNVKERTENGTVFGRFFLNPLL